MSDRKTLSLPGVDPAALEEARRAEIPEAKTNDGDDHSVSEETSGGEAVSGQDDTGSGSSEADIEQQARDRGWKPRDEWKGDIPDNFTDDPAEYLRKHEQSLNLHKRTIAELNRRLDQQEKVFSEHLERLNDAHARELRRRVTEAEQKIREAFRSGRDRDHKAALEEYTEAQAEAKAFSEKAEREAAQKGADRDYSQDPGFLSWLESKSSQWYREANADPNDPRVAWAMNEGVAMLNQAGVTIDMGEPFYRALSDMVAERFPKQSSPKPSAVEGSTSNSGGRKQKKGWNDIPAEDRNSEQTQMLLKKLYKGDKEKYAKAYFGIKENG